MKKSFPKVEWNSGLSTGLPHIDEQHRRLFDTINELGRVHETGADAPRIHAILDKLRAYASSHFQDEERLMAVHAVNAEQRNAHQAAHNEFTHYLDRIGALVSNHPGTAINLLLAFLLKWMLQHVAVLDLVMSDKMAAPGPQQDMADRKAAREAALLDSMGQLYDELGEQTFEMLELNVRLEQEIALRKRAEQETALSEVRFRAILDYAVNWEFWQSPDNHISYVSPSCERITGYSAEEFIRSPVLFYDIIHPEDRHLMEAHRTSNVEHEDGKSEIEYRIIRKNGDIAWIAHSCNTIYTRDGEFLGRRGCNRDLTERHKRDDSQRLAETVFNSVNEAVMVTDRENRIVAVNPSFIAITGFSGEDVLGRNPSMLSDSRTESDEVKSMWQEMASTGRWQGEIVNRRKSGELYIGWVSINSVRDAKGDIANYVSVFSDISERKISEKRMQYLAHYDLLTDLPNRALFGDRLQQGLVKARRDNELLALMFVDLDKFKSVNDTLGHHIGDLLLKEVAKRLRDCIRESDTAARIGGDEFVVILPDIQVEQDAVNVAEKILASIEAPCNLEGHDVRIGVSIGIAIYPMHGNSDEVLLSNADAAMYQAKHGGGPSIVCYGELAK